MILVNKTKDRLKRTDEHGRFVRVEPGETIQVSDEVGKYLLKEEKHTWREQKPAKKPQRKEAE